MDIEYIILEEVSVIDFTVIGCPLVHLGTMARRSNNVVNLEDLIPDDAIISVRKKNRVKFQYNLDHGIAKMITWTLLPVID